MLETLFGSQLRFKLLRSLYINPGERYFVRQIAVTINEDSTNVSRELARLEKAGFLVVTVEGRQKYYQANRQCPVFKEIIALMTSAPVTDITAVSSETLVQRLNINKSGLAGFCRLKHIQKLSLFGSVLRNDFKPQSDIDVLVEFQAGKTPGFIKLAGMEEELSVLLGGRKVDLRTPQDLSTHFRTRVMQEAQLLCP